MPPEDSLDLEHLASARHRASGLDIAVVQPSAHRQLRRLRSRCRRSPGVRVRLARKPADLAGADLVILPGSKSTMADLAWLRARGLARAIALAAAAGSQILGVCGGYQMLGRTLRDPDHLESSLDESPGLGLLPVETIFTLPRPSSAFRDGRVDVAALCRRDPHPPGLRDPPGPHRSRRPTWGAGRPPARVPDRRAGREAGGRRRRRGQRRHATVEGTYLHGVLADAGARRCLLAGLARRKGVASRSSLGLGSRSGGYDRLADIVGGALDMTAVARLVGLAYPRGG